jgi:hypothetical protein
MNYKVTKLYTKGPCKGTTWTDVVSVRYIRGRSYRDTEGTFVVSEIEPTSIVNTSGPAPRPATHRPRRQPAPGEA